MSTDSNSIAGEIQDEAAEIKSVPLPAEIFSPSQEPAVPLEADHPSPMPATWCLLSNAEARDCECANPDCDSAVSLPSGLNDGGITSVITPEDDNPTASDVAVIVLDSVAKDVDGHDDPKVSEGRAFLMKCKHIGSTVAATAATAATAASLTMEASTKFERLSLLRLAYKAPLGC